MIVAMTTTKPTKVAQSNLVHRGRLFNVELLEVKDAHGRVHVREVVRHPGAVLIVPVLDATRVVMIRNNRAVVDERLWEFPAGKLETGEDPKDAAGRELEEETGFRAASVRKLGEFYTSPGFTDELMRVFVAEGLSKFDQRLEADEDIEVEAVSLAEVAVMVRDGRLRDGKSIAGFHMWRNQLEEQIA
jgi:ADP-ribose pyrophosphatase